MNSPRRILFLFVLVLILLAGGTFGYRFIEGWTLTESLYMTIITISTVGFGEVRPLSLQGMQFTIVFITLSIVTVGYAVTVLISFVFGGQIFRIIKERKMRHLLTIIKDHYIICGFGSVGKETAEELSRKKAKFVILEKSPEQIDKSRFPNYLFIEGDASEEETLTAAKIGKARGLISCLPDDQQNVFVVLTARQLNSALQIVSKASDERTIRKLTKAGADRVISPQQIAGKRLAAVSIQPSIVDFLDVIGGQGEGALRMESVGISERSPLVGKTLRDSNIGQFTGAVVIGIIDKLGRTRINPSAQASLASIQLNEGDQLIALGSDSQLQQLFKFAGTGRYSV